MLSRKTRLPEAALPSRLTTTYGARCLVVATCYGTSMDGSLEQLVHRNHALLRRVWATRLVACDIRDHTIVTMRGSESAARNAADLRFATWLGMLRQSLYPCSNRLVAVRAVIWARRASLVCGASIRRRSGSPSLARLAFKSNDDRPTAAGWRRNRLPS
jgi:hypothetical protein